MAGKASVFVEIWARSGTNTRVFVSGGNMHAWSRVAWFAMNMYIDREPGYVSPEGDLGYYNTPPHFEKGSPNCSSNAYGNSEPPCLTH